MKASLLYLILPLLPLTFATPLPQSSGVPPNTFLNTILSAFSSSIPAVGESINSIGSDFTVLETALAATLGVATSENLSGCPAMAVIFARGTTEPGNVGLFTGPPFLSALQAQLGSSNVQMQGVEYAASVEGFLAGGDDAGATTMASLVNQTMSSCPNTKIVMSGYSQGGQVVHKAAAQLPAATMSKVSSVVIFGDPDDGSPVASTPSSNLLVVCHADDNICQHGDLILIAHLTYSMDADQAATFVATAAGMGGGN